jgi:hypothetical protein
MEQGASLLDDLKSPKASGPTTDCGLTKIKSQMDTEEASALERAVEMIREDQGSGRSKVYSSEWLTGVLRKHGHDISSSTVARHVAKRCRCERTV